jgi:hypothetical protein
MDGPRWTDNPPCYSCIEACAYLFGGVAVDYSCSTSNVVINHQAYLDGWGDTRYCLAATADDYKLGVNYNCGAGSCSFSAYVSDHACASVNYCWLGG